MNAGAAAFTDASGSLPPLPALGAAVFLDADLDQDEDLVAAAWGASGTALYVFLGDGSGVFGAGTALLPEPGWSCHELMAGDLDADGDMDLLAADPGSGLSEDNGARHLWLADVHGGFQESNGDVVVAARGVLLGDLDGLSGGVELFLAGEPHPSSRETLRALGHVATILEVPP